MLNRFKRFFDRSFVGRGFNRFKRYSLKKKLIISTVTLLVFMLVLPLVTYAYFARDISDRERLMNRNSTGIQLMDRKGKAFYSFGKVNERNDYPLSDIPKELQQAVIASEDKDFYSHAGFSVKGIAGALFANVQSKDATKYGGSTITQQLVKNNLLTSNKSYLRKYQEFSIAIAVDRHYSKDDILEMYLNSVYFGEGAFGIESASKAYFNKEPKDLTLAESSMLIGILPAPSAYSPISGDADEAKKQQTRVLNQMLDNEFISKAEQDTALATEISYQSAPDAVNENAEHYAQMILKELDKRYGEERVTRSGFVVKTGLDLNMQKIAEEQVKKRVAQLESQGGRNSSLVAIDPKSGEIRALVGSADFSNQEFGMVNMAVTPRQPGSSFKPVYHAEALDRKLITPATVLHDSPRTFGSYKPQNYDFKYMGDITARRALAQSRNLTAIEVMEKLGVEEASEAARRMGISTINEPEKYGLTLALGTAEATLMDMTNAYAAYANEGMQREPITILSIEDKFGREIFRNDTKEKRVQSAEASFLISSMLSDTQARAPTFNSLNIPGRTVAVKTGTTDENKDAWTIGYTPSLAIGVWVGNNESEAMTGVAGASGAGPIWRNTMQQILADTPRESFEQPRAIEKVLVCSANGFRASAAGPGTYTEFFIRGTSPSRTCNVAPKEEPKKDEEKEEKKQEEVKEEPKKEDEKVENPVEEEEETGTVEPQPTAAACSDKKDNDGDGLRDALDPGCSSPEDNDETDPPTSPAPTTQSTPTTTTQQAS